MTKQKSKSTQANINLRSFGALAGIGIAFLMFNNIIMAILFGLPIGLGLTMALQKNLAERAGKK